MGPGFESQRDHFNEKRHCNDVFFIYNNATVPFAELFQNPIAAGLKVERFFYGFIIKRMVGDVHA